MPGVSGVQLLDHIRSFDSAIPVLFMSGFAAIDRTQAIQTRGNGSHCEVGGPDELMSKLKLLLEADVRNVSIKTNVPPMPENFL